MNRASSKTCPKVWATECPLSFNGFREHPPNHSSAHRRFRRVREISKRMSHGAEITLVRSPAAERMRLHRERRRKGLRCLTIELRETEIDALIRKGMLKIDARNDQHAILN